MVGLAESKFAAMVPAVMDYEATSRRITLLVGSARAWKTSNCLGWKWCFSFAFSHKVPKVLPPDFK